MRDLTLNETPIRTSKNYGMNNITIKDFELPKNIKDFNSISITGDVSDFEISDNINKYLLIYGISRELEEANYKYGNYNKKIQIDGKGNLNLNFSLNEDDVNLLDNIEIDANENAEATIVIKYKSNDDLKYFHNGILRVNSRKNSKTNIVILNMLNNQSYNFLSIENVLEEDSTLNYTIVDFGGKTSVTNWYSNLNGKKSKANIDTIYLGIEKQVFDLNYISELYGEYTETNIEVQGALKDDSQKNFKGTIDFKKGSKKAKGNENEFCTLLSDKAKSKALPILLCKEEDVEGNHSTACGKIENEQLFYIMSRGISYNDAMKLLVKAKFNNIIENIEDDELKQYIINKIDTRLN